MPAWHRSVVTERLPGWAGPTDRHRFAGWSRRPQFPAWPGSAQPRHGRRLWQRWLRAPGGRWHGRRLKRPGHRGNRRERGTAV